MNEALILTHNKVRSGSVDTTYEHEKPDKCEERCDSTSLYSHYSPKVNRSDTLIQGVACEW